MCAQEHVTSRVLTFALSDSQTGREGVALLVPDAHYISIAWPGEPRLERRYADPDGWRLLERAIDEPLPAMPLDATHVIVRMLLPSEQRRRISVRYLGDGQVDARLRNHVPRLDEWLLQHFECDAT